MSPLKFIENLTDEAKKKYKVCEECDRFNSEHRRCMECGCFMPIKVTIPLTHCPKQKW